METVTNESAQSLANLLGLSEWNMTAGMKSLVETDARYIRELKMNMSSVLESQHLSSKETHLLAYCCSVNIKNEVLAVAFASKLRSMEVGEKEIAEAAACASLLSANNVLYRFRHFTGKETYKQMPARLRMNLMMQPETGKKFFELMSLAVSAVNGCEMCVNAHEHSVRELGYTEEQIFDSIRLASMFSSLSVLVH